MMNRPPQGRGQPRLGATWYPGGQDDFYMPEVISPSPQRCVSLVHILPCFVILSPVDPFDPFFAVLSLLSGSPWWNERTLFADDPSLDSRAIGSCLKCPKPCSIISLISNGKPAISIAVSMAWCNTTGRSSIHHELPRPLPPWCMGRLIKQVTMLVPTNNRWFTITWTSLIFRPSPFCGTPRQTFPRPMNNEKQV